MAKGSSAAKEQHGPGHSPHTRARGQGKHLTAKVRSASPGKAMVAKVASTVAQVEPTPDARAHSHTADKGTSANPRQDHNAEFGGWPGALVLMIWSHCMPLYMWISLEFHGGAIFGPASLAGSELQQYATHELFPKLAQAVPGWTAWGLYLGFFLSQIALFFVCPGVTVRGLPVPSEGNRRFEYRCNAFSSWLVTLGVVIVLHVTGLFSLSIVSRLRGQLLVVAMIASDVIALAVYCWAVFIEPRHSFGLSGNHLYDFFMGAWLNPRIGALDLKLWAEIKMSWVTLFLLVLASAVQQYETLGYLTNGMLVIVVAQLLYANACMKGEECVPGTWDIFHEKWGWMLIYWNLCGVPFVYTFQAEYIGRASAATGPSGVADLGTPATTALLLVLMLAYYLWDISNQQKNTYRLMQRGEYHPRPWYQAFPQLPGGVLHKEAGSDAWRRCRVLTFDAGKKAKAEGKPLTLLVDGVWRYGRKIHYGMDLIMAMIWAGSTLGASSQEPHVLNFFYPAFFAGMMLHRCALVSLPRRVFVCTRARYMRVERLQYSANAHPAYYNTNTAPTRTLLTTIQIQRQCAHYFLQCISHMRQRHELRCLLSRLD